ncbi:RimJ/RimL family protein N-acetyltransferase [Candidatus Poribacteria bacterium]|nr:RimJ/RimL family protein N-acetyltransferase [Candidatus Poribacteria bacterium]
MAYDLLTFSREIDSEVTLRTLRARDATALYALIDGNRAHLREWLPFVDDAQDVTDTQRFILEAAQLADDQKSMAAGIWDGGILAGVIGLMEISVRNRKAEIGYWLAAEHQGRGLVTRACRALITYAFDTVRLHRVEIYCAPENTRSRAIPERLGFVIEGTLREAEWLYDHYVDNVLYAMLAPAWDASS